MLVREVMTGAVITAPPWMPILEARNLMVKERIRHLPVRAPRGELLGMITDRDIRLNLPSQATSLSVWEIKHLLSKLTVDEVMTQAVITVGPDIPAREAARLMIERQIGALEAARRERLQSPRTEAERRIVHLMRLGAIGPGSAC